MTDRQAGRVTVRPKFFAWLAFVLTVPVLVHAAWVYTEARGLRARLEAIHAKGEPTSIEQVRPVRQLTASGVEAARLYRAAAALASNWNGTAYVPLAPPNNVMNPAAQDWSATQRAEANRLVSANSAVLDLLDRATALEFLGFPPGTDYSYRFAELWQLEQLASLRTRVLAVDQRDSAVRALHVQMLLRQAFDLEYPSTLGWFVEIMARDVALVVGRVRPTHDSFAALEAVLRSLDRDDRVKRILLAQRADWLNDGVVRPRTRLSPAASPWETVRRPFNLHMVNQIADMQAQNIEHADRPWPQRLESFRNVDLGPISQVKDMRAMQEYGVASTVRQEARNTALLRAVRVALAIERARQFNTPPEIPKLIDPFSGETMRVKRDGASYAVYSVGTNGRDDGGHATLDVTFRPVPPPLPNP